MSGRIGSRATPRGRAATQKQINYLRSLGDTDPAPVDSKDASWRINAALNKGKQHAPMTLTGPIPEPFATPRQIQLLVQLGYTGPTDITSKEAVQAHSYLRQTKDRW